PQKTAEEWFAEYGISHQHPLNRAIHWVCVPAIFWSVLGFIWTIPLPATLDEQAPWFNWTLLAIALATGFYVQLSPALSAGMLFFMALCYALLVAVDLYAPWPVWRLACVVFLVAWAGQFAGHLIEHRAPSLRKDLVFLFIGPAWLMSKVYRKIGQKY